MTSHAPRKLITAMLLLPCLLAAGMVTTVAAQQSEQRWVETDNSNSRRTRGVGVGEGSYYKDRERGYYFYEEDPEAAKRQREQAPTVTISPPSQQHEPMSVKWLQEKLEETRIAAIDNPTRENVELYVYLQKISMDKAEKFALMSQQVAMINPDLDESMQNPTTTYARGARMRAQEGEQERVMRQVAETTGIYYFFKSDCEYCAKQNATLTALVEQYGFHVLPISVDHAGMPGGAFPSWVPDRGQAAKLGITATPTLYLFHPPNEVAFLSAGLQTEGQLRKRILQVSNANGWLSKEDLEKALRGLPRDFLVDAVQDLGEVDWTNPSSALEALRYASQKGVERAKASDVMGVGPAVNAGPQATPIEP